MLTIRRSQWTTLADHALATFKAQLFAMLRERSPAMVESLGRERVESLIDTCVDTCREYGESGREAITLAVESLLATEGVESLPLPDVARVVRGEIEARRLYSLLETLADLEAR